MSSFTSRHEPARIGGDTGPEILRDNDIPLEDDPVNPVDIGPADADPSAAIHPLLPNPLSMMDDSDDIEDSDFE
jgi:hypothetical protein